jgi:hypothetical protein
MKNVEPREQNEPLSKAMQGWKVATPLPPHFQEEIWQRIARAEAKDKLGLWSEFLSWLEVALPRWDVAASYVTILLLAGLTAGYWESRHKAAELDDALGRRYVQMVDPFQTHEP